jgi:hypothetical protein
MSYAPHTIRSQQGRTFSTGAEAGSGRPTAADASRSAGSWSKGRSPGRSPGRSSSESSTESRDWVRVGMFGAGVAVGALLGAGAALLYAPQSGIEARTLLRGRARRAKLRATNRWDELGAELRGAARRSKRRLRRGVAKSRWRAADSLDY